MAKDKDSLVSGHNGHALAFFLGCTHNSKVDSVAITLLSIATRLLISLRPPLLILLAPLISFLFLHSVAHSTGLAIPRPVQAIAGSPPPI
jgi:hypothetical protein